MLVETDSQNPLVFSSYELAKSSVYLKYFGFVEAPFSLLPKKQFFFEHASAIQMIHTVTFSLASGESIVKVTGESGAGKTYLINRVMSSLSEDCYVIQISTPNMSPIDFLKCMVEELGAVYPLDANESQLLKFIQYLLCDHYTKTDYRIVIWVDDAHKLPNKTLDMITALSKMQTTCRLLLQFVISGTPVLNDKLARCSLVQLKERVGFSAELSGLSFSEMKNYLQTRLKIAGASNVNCFSHAAMSMMYQKTSGLPAKINKFSHKALMLAYGKGEFRVEKSHVWRAANEEISDSLSNKHFTAFGLYLVASTVAWGLCMVIYFEWFIG